MAEVEDQILYSRSARDLMGIGEQHPDLMAKLTEQRTLLGVVSEGRDRLEEALDAERRALIRANETRLEAYNNAAEKWRSAWPDVAGEISGLSRLDAHHIVVERADGVLPMNAASSTE